MNLMTEKLVTLWPEITMLIGACLCLLTGLVHPTGLRRATVWVAGATLIVAALFVLNSPDPPVLARYIKLAVCGVGLLLLLVAAGLPSELRIARATERGTESFDAAHAMRGEFFAFFLFSLTGVMLCAGASDLVWLFLALELTSLPTYVMVAITRNRVEAQEAAVKYFFLGALAAAVFLYGFTLIYGATGFTNFEDIRRTIAAGDISPLLLTGLVLSIVGVSYKIAAVPMHFYAADVYQGAATPVTAFLAFVPKTAGFVSLILLLGLVGDEMPPQITWLLWIMAALTMTVGNVLGLLQSSVKRALAYSSIAHSGYMLVGLLGGISVAVQSEPLRNGYAAVLFYLVAYGLANLGAFAVLACIESRGDEADTYDDIAGLSRRHPGLAAIMLLSLLSLIGLPPMIGFVGKVYLFGSVLTGQNARFEAVSLIVIAVLNSAISAVYYLRIASACFFADPNDFVRPVPTSARRLGAALAALAAAALGVAGGRLVDAAAGAFSDQRPRLALPDSSPPTRTLSEPTNNETMSDQHHGSDDAGQ